jgi:hypothetical protein
MVTIELWGPRALEAGQSPPCEGGRFAPSDPTRSCGSHGGGPPRELTQHAASELCALGLQGAPPAGLEPAIFGLVPRPCPFGPNGLAEATATARATAEQRARRRHRGDSNPCGQSPVDFESISLAARTQRRSQSCERPVDGNSPRRNPKRGRDRRPTNGDMALPCVSLREVVGWSATGARCPRSAQGGRERPRESTGPPKTRTWNLWLRSPTPYPFGQRPP